MLYLSEIEQCTTIGQHIKLLFPHMSRIIPDAWGYIPICMGLAIPMSGITLPYVLGDSPIISYKFAAQELEKNLAVVPSI